MRTFLATSNHGNHTGFNRKWTVELVPDNYSLTDIADKVSDNHIWIDEQYFKDYPEALDEGNMPEWYDGPGIYDDNSNVEVLVGATSYEHDLIYYLLIKESEIDTYAYDSGHYAGLYSKLCAISGKEE